MAVIMKRARNAFPNLRVWKHSIMPKTLSLSPDVDSAVYRPQSRRAVTAGPWSLPFTSMIIMPLG